MNWRIALIIGGSTAVMGAAALLAPADEDEDREPAKQLTAYEAACGMLEDGDTPVEAFDILVGLDVSELTASRAVNEATANGCA